MTHFNERKSYTIERVDGGYVIDWVDPETEEERRRRSSMMAGSYERPKSGRSIVTTDKALITALKRFFGI